MFQYLSYFKFCSGRKSQQQSQIWLAPHTTMNWSSTLSLYVILHISAYTYTEGMYTYIYIYKLYAHFRCPTESPSMLVPLGPHEAECWGPIPYAARIPVWYTDHIRGRKDHLNIRMLHTMISGIPGVLCLRSRLAIVLCLRGFWAPTESFSRSCSPMFCCMLSSTWTLKGRKTMAKHPLEKPNS